LKKTAFYAGSAALALILSACASQQPAPVVVGNSGSNSGSANTASNNPYGAAPYETNANIVKQSVLKIIDGTATEKDYYNLINSLESQTWLVKLSPWGLKLYFALLTENKADKALLLNDMHTLFEAANYSSQSPQSKEFKATKGKTAKYEAFKEKLFDPDFDGEPVKVLETGAKTNNGTTPGFVNEGGDPVEKYIVTDKQVTILNSTVQVLDENGKLITESLTDYTRKNILGSYATLNDFITVWHTADKKKLILDELYKKGVYLDAIRESEGISEQEIDDFDLLLKLAYGQKELTKTERVNKLKQSGYLYKYSEEARAVLEILLDKYMDKGIGELESIETLKLPEFQIYGGTFKIINTYFGDKKRYLQAIKELEKELFTVA